MSDLSTARAHALALVTQIVGFVVAFVPNLSSSQQVLVGAGSTALAVAILIAHAVRTRPAGESPEKAIEQFVAQTLGHVDFNTLAADAIGGKLPALVAAEVRKLIGVGLAAQAAPAAPAAPAPAAPPVQSAPPVSA